MPFDHPDGDGKTIAQRLSVVHQACSCAVCEIVAGIVDKLGFLRGKLLLPISALRVEKSSTSECRLRLISPPSRITARYLVVHTSRLPRFSSCSFSKRGNSGQLGATSTSARRGDLREFPDFDEDRPGVPPRPWDGTRRLGGSSLSRTHARIHATGA